MLRPSITSPTNSSRAVDDATASDAGLFCDGVVASGVSVAAGLLCVWVGVANGVILSSGAAGKVGGIGSRVLVDSDASLLASIVAGGAVSLGTSAKSRIQPISTAHSDHINTTKRHRRWLDMEQ